MSKLAMSGAVLAALMAVQGAAQAVTFSSAAATFEQAGGWTATKAMDGLIPASGALNSGWAISDFAGDHTESQTALFTLTTPLAQGTYTLVYTLTQNYGSQHTLDTFSLAVANSGAPALLGAQTPVSITAATATGGAALSFTGANVDASGPSPVTSVYTITATIASATPITGLYLNALNFPATGPGRQPSNGNFVLTEFAVAATPVPEPSQWALMGAGLAVVSQLVRQRKKVS